LNAFTGGTAGSSLFDITGDRQINEKDLVKLDVDGDGNPEELAPSGLNYGEHPAAGHPAESATMKTIPLR